MKKSHIIGIAVIAIAIAIIVSTAGDASSYVTFGEAKLIADNGNPSKIHVVGTLKKGPHDSIIGMQYFWVWNVLYRDTEGTLIYDSFHRDASFFTLRKVQIMYK